MSNPNGTIDIHDNATGCNTKQEVEEACESASVAEQLPKTKIYLFPNPASQEFNIIAEGYTIDELTIYNLTGQQVMHARPVNGKV